AMWIAAALAAGMAGFFVLARVDEKGGAGGAGGAPAREETGNSTAAGAPPPPPPPPTPAIAPAGGETATVPLQSQSDDKPEELEPAGLADAGVERLAGTSDAGPGRVRGKMAKKRARPPVQRKGPEPPVKQQVFDPDAPENSPEEQQAVEAE
ncbi:MAG TPA: hypothetical protein VFU21_27520, partial [Kofleriaceae bacterium]|nr:hypothetical protein [Kofleriaceae bacterium]